MMQGNVQTDGLDEYNPFSSNSSASAPVRPPPPPKSAQGDVNAELDRRQKELEARARELDRREQEYAERQRLQQGPESVKNWPPFPSFCPCQPCFHQDFDADFPEATRSMARQGYFLWFGYTVTLMLNVLGALAYFIKAQPATTDASATFATSIILLVLLVPLSFICWYRPVYRALKTDSSFHYFLFFFTFALQIVIIIVQCLGFLWLPSCGWINSLSMLKQNTAVAVIMLIIASLFTLLAVLSAIYLLKVHRHYRSTGASFQKAKQEFGQNVASNETVRTAAYSAVVSQPTPR